MSGSSSGSCSSSAESSLTVSCSGDGKTSSCCTVLSENEKFAPERTKLDETSLFPHVRTVSLNNSMFDCWEEVSVLRSWPSLAELRMQSCPLFRVSNLFYFLLKRSLCHILKNTLSLLYRN